MRLLVTFATVGVFGFLATHASADDLYPPDWRTDPPGQGFTTFQMWEFGTDDNPVGPDVVYNAFGDPTATITGDWPLTLWKDEDFGHYGVWRFEDWMELFIPNNPEPEESKYIWLQITFSAGEGHDPEILSLPDWADLEIINHIQLDDYYYHGTYLITIEPNPEEELLVIMPRDCTLYVDEIVVDTICVPEPASLTLLAVFGLLLARRR